MIRPIKIKLNAAHPELPLVEATTFVGSPSTVFVCDVPKAVGSWRISTVKVVAHYPDDSATTVECVKGADGVYTATLPATATSGRVTHGFEVLADAIDENGDPVTGYVLGFADFAVFTRDMTIESGGTLYYMHYFDAVPQTPKKGDVAPDGSGGLQFYNGTAWQPFAVVPPIQYPVTSVNGQTGAVNLTASDVGVHVVKISNGAHQVTVNGYSFFVDAVNIVDLSSGDVTIYVDEEYVTIPAWALNSTKPSYSWSEIEFRPEASDANPLMDGVASPGVSSGGQYSKYDHVHPTDTSRAPLNSPTFTGTPTAPDIGANTSSQVTTKTYVDAQVGSIQTFQHDSGGYYIEVES